MKHTRKKWRISCFLDLIEIASFQQQLVCLWAQSTRAGCSCAEFPTKSTWLSAEKQQQQRVKASASRCSVLQEGTTEVWTKALWLVILCKETFKNPLIGGIQNEKPENNDGQGNCTGIQGDWIYFISSPVSVLLQSLSFPVLCLISL